MAWILLLLAIACFLVPFFTTSFALGVACMLVALVLVVTAMLLLLAARVGGATRNVRALSAEELRVLREQVKPELRDPTDAAADTTSGSPPPASV